MYAATAYECVSRHLWNYQEPVCKTPKREEKTTRTSKNKTGLLIAQEQREHNLPEKNNK